MAFSLKGVLGGGGADPQATADLGQARKTLTLQQALGQKYGTLADGAAADFGADNGGYRSAVDAEASYLKQDPFTDQRSTEALADATRGSAQHFQNANALLSSGLAARGITDGSELAGGLASNAQAYQSSQDAASNALARQKIATADQNRRSLVDLLGGEASTDYNRQTGAMGAESGIDSSLYSGYDHMGQEEQARADQQSGALMGLIGGVASIAGQGGYGTIASYLTKKKPAGVATANTAPSGSLSQWTMPGFGGGL